MRNIKGITLIGLIVTIIILIILAGVVINLSVGENGIFNKAKEASSRYEETSIREKVELGIANIEIEELEVKNKVTVELVLQELVEDGTFESIDKEESIGNIGEYEVKLKYNEQQKVVIEYVKKANGVRITYTLNPVGYTKEEKVEILFKVQGKVKSITSPEGLIIYPRKEVTAADYIVTANGRYKFIVEKEDGNKTEKEVIVDTIDTLPPKAFTITAENTGEGFIITNNAEDAEETQTSVKSGIEKIEYYVKKESESVYTKYETSEIKGLDVGTYNIYAIAYDRAGNKKQTTTITAEVKLKIKFSKVVVGYYHNLGIDIEGNLWAWGANDYGQLGDGSSIKKLSPVKIKVGTKFKEISTTEKHSLAIDEEGNLWAWGYNSDGELGNGTTENSKLPVKIKEETKFIKVSAGMNCSLAIDEEGNLWAWGNNNRGQLGNDTMTSSLVPILVKEGTKFTKIAASYSRSMAIDSEGNLWAWGDFYYKQTPSYQYLGDGEYNGSLVPKKIKEGTKFEEIEEGYNNILAIDIEGNIWSWGENSQGQLGDGTYEEKIIPVQILKENTFKKIAVKRYHCMAVDTSGNLWAWGNNSFGQLGDNSTISILLPIKINEEIKFREISVGQGHSIAIDEEGNLWACGWNWYGQLGDGTQTDSLILKKIF